MSAAFSRHSLRSLLAGYDVPAPDVEVAGVELDSRRVSPGDLFLACKGQGQHHGLDHLEQALERGASAIAWEPAPGRPQPDLAIPAVAVPQLSRRAGEIASRYHGEPTRRLFMAGVTGTDGKTSTAYLIAQALDALDQPCAYLGTLGYGRIGHLDAATHTTPDAVSLQRRFAQFVADGARAAAMEVSSHALDQDRVSGVHFDAAVLTNITRDHLDYHGTVENYAAAKRRLFERPGLRAAVLNRDDAHGAQWLREFGDIAVAYGLDGDTPTQGRHVLGRGLQLRGDGLAFDIDSSWGGARLESRLLGRFNAYNLLAALAVLLQADVPLARAVQALTRATTVPGRIEGYRGALAAPLVVVDYAHTPQALEQILKAVRAHTAGRLWCVFGCGGDRDRGKRPLMAAAAARLADEVVITDDNPRSESPAAIVAEIRAGLPGGHPARVIHDRAEAIATAVRAAGRDDTVVVAGKGHEDYQIYGSETRAFSDRGFVAGLVGLEPRP
ncbi:MAG: UDP-N-acetylmuramoyl-L-alanyl-D-glutamate--2,6-diaminopimelate ligase [Nevskiaceae bacterium]|nr:MAG: UDP-N-acetylmuramoyl-L-alanyl-D-glutamate--2,6-diaminopimelate ligase [Nevskiaceae bacterium]